MVTMNQLQNGIAAYIDREVLPHLTGMKRVGLGVYAAMAAGSIGPTLMKYRDHPAVAVLDVIDKDGNVDIDKLYRAALPMFQEGEKQHISIPLIGDMTVDRTDLEKLYQYIKA